MSAYGFRMLYTPSFRSEVSSLQVYLDGEKVMDAKISDKKITIDKELFSEEKKYTIEVKGVLTDGRIVPIYETTYGEDAQVNTYKVTFVGKDGDFIKEEEVKEGKSATAPNAPAVEGYTFKEWDKDFTNVTSDLEVKALYEINKYTVKFVGNDGKEITSKIVEYGKAATAPDAPVVEGYKFTGWDKEFTNVKEDLVVTALYEKVNTYTVTFVDKDGKEISKVEVEEGKAAKAPDAPVVEGYKFTGWDKEFTNVTSDLEVKALYEELAKKYTVTFVDKDGKEISKVEVEEGKAATAPSAPKVDGFNFTGWDKEFTNVTSDLVVKAQYEEAKKSGGCNSASILFTSIMLLGLCFIRRRKF